MVYKVCPRKRALKKACLGQFNFQEKYQVGWITFICIDVWIMDFSLDFLQIMYARKTLLLLLQDFQKSDSIIEIRTVLERMDRNSKSSN